MNINQLQKFNKITGNNFTISSFSETLNNLLYNELCKIIDDINIDIEPDDIEKELQRIIKNFKITNSFCQTNFNCTVDDLATLIDINNIGKLINDETYFYLLNAYSEHMNNYLYNDDYSSTPKKESTNSLGQYLYELDNDDKIGKYFGEIDYNPEDIDLRSGPIVVYKNKYTNQDEVLIGKYGDYHYNIMPVDITDKAIVNSKEYISYCYFYKPLCAYVDKFNSDYTVNEVVNILKNDSRIEKVYLSPGTSGGKLKRLAKLKKP